jgi:hypothetical protein
MSCAIDGSLARIPDLGELSGLSASRRTPGQFWAHNDSGKPVLFALDASASITDGAVSADGIWAVLRSGSRLSVHRFDALQRGDWSTERSLSVKDANEPQGEGIAITADRTIYLAGEGGGGRRPGTFARACGLSGLTASSD